MNLSRFEEASRYKALASSQVVPDAFRCVQCGICSYNCPIGIDVRRFAWQGKSVVDSHCITCSECIARCPRRAPFRAHHDPQQREGQMTRYVILGMGAAGIAAAETIRQLDPQGEIICASAEGAGYYSRPGLAYYLSKELGQRSLFPFSKQDFKDRQFKLVHNTVVKIDTVKREVIFRDQKRLQYDRLLLALGAEAVRPKIEGIELDGVVYLNSFSQTQRMVKLARRTRNAIVVGGGITALEIVEGLQARKVQVHFFLRGENYWNRVLDPIESQLVLSRLRHEGVQIHLNTELDRIIGKRGKVHAVLTKDGSQIKAGMVAFAIGVQPRTRVAAASGLEVNRGVKINQFMETSTEGVYAAGDVAEVYDPESGRWVVDSLWPIARQQGIICRNEHGRRITSIPSRQPA